jgi:hypothetical protein
MFRRKVVSGEWLLAGAGRAAEPQWSLVIGAAIGSWNGLDSGTLSVASGSAIDDHC